MGKSQLPRCTPESQGISSAAIIRFIEEVERNISELHSFILLRHGAVVAEGWWSPYAPERPHMLFSLSKSFTSSAIGLAVAEGRLTVNDPVISFFPEDTPAEVSENLRAMRVKQLLSMSTGHAEDTTDRITRQADPNWVKAFLSLPVEYRPGTHFVYNSGATYMLAAIVQKVTGMTLVEYLTPRLFEPLGIEGATWETSPQGINMGGWGLNITTEDIARFGQMYLQKGKWNGRQILPEAWVAEASMRQVSNGSNPDSDWEQGYGYQFWRCKHGAFRGDGAFGQYCIVMPEQDAVLAITSGVNDMQAPLNVIWEYLLPEMGPAPLPAQVKAQTALQQKLSSLVLLPPQGKSGSPVATQVSEKEYKFEANDMKIEGVSFEFTAEGTVFNLHGATSPNTAPVLQLGGVVGEHRIVCGDGAWHMGVTSLFGRGEQPVFASGVWTAEDTYVMTMRLVHTPFYFNHVCRFEGSQVEIQMKQNVGFGPQDAPALIGRSK
jgi:CubicO group peptidase (beta-lactamase class C family)